MTNPFRWLITLVLGPASEPISMPSKAPPAKPTAFYFESYSDKKKAFTIGVSHPDKIDKNQLFLDCAAQLATDIKNGTEDIIGRDVGSKPDFDAVRRDSDFLKARVIKSVRGNLHRFLPDVPGTIELLTGFLEKVTVVDVEGIKIVSLEGETHFKLPIQCSNDDGKVEVSRPRNGKCTITSQVFTPEELEELRAPMFPDWSPKDYEKIQSDVATAISEKGGFSRSPDLGKNGEQEHSP